MMAESREPDDSIDDHGRDDLTTITESEASTLHETDDQFTTATPFTTTQPTTTQAATTQPATEPAATTLLDNGDELVEVTTRPTVPPPPVRAPGDAPVNPESLGVVNNVPYELVTISDVGNLPAQPVPVHMLPSGYVDGYDVVEMPGAYFGMPKGQALPPPIPYVYPSNSLHPLRRMGDLPPRADHSAAQDTTTTLLPTETTTMVDDGVTTTVTPDADAPTTLTSEPLYHVYGVTTTVTPDTVSPTTPKPKFLYHGDFAAELHRLYYSKPVFEPNKPIGDEKAVPVFRSFESSRSFY